MPVQNILFDPEHPFVLRIEHSVNHSIEEKIDQLMASVEQLQQDVQTLVGAVRDRLSNASDHAQTLQEEVDALREQLANAPSGGIDPSALDGVDQAVQALLAEVQGAQEVAVPPETTPDDDSATTVGGEEADSATGEPPSV